MPEFLATYWMKRGWKGTEDSGGLKWDRISYIGPYWSSWFSSVVSFEATHRRKRSAWFHFSLCPFVLFSCIPSLLASHRIASHCIASSCLVAKPLARVVAHELDDRSRNAHASFFFPVALPRVQDLQDQ